MIRPLAVVLLALGLVVVGSAPATSQESFPSRPITIINPFPPGGTADLTGRPLAAALEKSSSSRSSSPTSPAPPARSACSRSPVAKPDGYTILITVPSITTLPEVDKLFGRPPAFTRDQFVPIARVNADPAIIVVNAEQPWKSVKDLLDDAKKRPGEITFASSGIYGASHVPMEMMLHVGGRPEDAPPADGGRRPRHDGGARRPRRRSGARRPAPPRRTSSRARSAPLAVTRR